MERLNVRNADDARRVLMLHVISAAHYAIDQGGRAIGGGAGVRNRGWPPGPPKGIPEDLGAFTYLPPRTPPGNVTTLGRAARGHAKMGAGLASDRDVLTLARDHEVLYGDTNPYGGPLPGTMSTIYAVRITPLTVQTRSGETYVLQDQHVTFNSAELEDRTWDIIRMMKSTPLRSNGGRLEFKPSLKPWEEEAWTALAQLILDQAKSQCMKQSA